MPRDIKRTRVGRQFLGLLKNAIAMEDGAGLGSISYRLPVASCDGRPPLTYTVYLTPNEDGSFLATCRELPEVTVLATGEEEALSMAEQAIKDTLQGGR